MWSRFSLRLQIVLILVLVLGAEALFSSAWLLKVLPHTLKVDAEHVAKTLLAASAGELRDACGIHPNSGCVRSVLEVAEGSGIFAAIRFHSSSGETTVGTPSGRPDVTLDDGTEGELDAWLDLRTERARAAQLFEFHLANLALAAAALVVLGMTLFNRAVAIPVEKLAAVADRIGHLELAELGSDLDTPMLGQLSSSFERMARVLKHEQERVSQQIAELTRMNKELKDARDAVVRQEKLATVGRLAAGIAHEVGNPLGGILGYAELLKMKGDATTQEYAGRIEREVARIDNTVRGLLDFSRPSEAKLTPITLASSVDRALALCQADKRFRAVEPLLELAADLPPVMADEHRLGQVLVNLLLNAGDAMHGAGKVTLRAAVVEDAAPHRRASDPPPGRRVELAIEDTGPGIPAEVLPRIFDPFFSTKEVGEGTGLGLSISASIMDAFGGELRAENRAEGGARFWVVLRAAPREGTS